MKSSLAIMGLGLCLCACSNTPSQDNDDGLGDFIVRIAVDLAVDIAASNDDRPRGLGAKENEECRQLVRCESVFEAEIRREREAREYLQAQRDAQARERAAAINDEFHAWMTRDKSLPELSPATLSLPASLVLPPVHNETN